MDVDHIEHQVVERNNDQERWKAYNRANGARMSAMEHMVPEVMFSTEDNPAHGISAVKALQIAAAEGQKIWTITQANLSTALAAIDLPADIETDIRNSVYAGKEVTTHETAVDFYGSSQVGYIVIYPGTGAGGYLIGGGENGGELMVATAALTAIGFLGFAGVMVGVVTSLLVAYLATNVLVIGAGFFLLLMKGDTSGAGWEAALSRVIAIIGMALLPIFSALSMNAAGGLAADAFTKAGLWAVAGDIVGHIIALWGAL